MDGVPVEVYAEFIAAVERTGLTEPLMTASVRLMHLMSLEPCCVEVWFASMLDNMPMPDTLDAYEHTD